MSPLKRVPLLLQVLKKSKSACQSTTHLNAVTNNEPSSTKTIFLRLKQRSTINVLSNKTFRWSDRLKTVTPTTIYFLNIVSLSFSSLSNSVYTLEKYLLSYLSHICRSIYSHCCNMIYGTMNMHCCSPYPLYVQLKKYKLTIPLANVQFGLHSAW